MSKQAPVLDQDLVVCEPAFGAAIVTAAPVPISGSGALKVAGKKVCLEGDEANISFPPFPYMTGAFPIPGMGSVKIELGSDQRSEKMTNEKALILCGTKFKATFEVSAPASHPQAGPDSTTKYEGKGSFTLLTPTPAVSFS